jgi:hypothetical protein
VFLIILLVENLLECDNLLKSFLLQIESDDVGDQKSGKDEKSKSMDRKRKAVVQEIDLDDESSEIFEVERILDYKKSGRSEMYLVKWKGYGKDAATWESSKQFYEIKDLCFCRIQFTRM